MSADFPPSEPEPAPGSKPAEEAGSLSAAATSAEVEAIGIRLKRRHRANGGAGDTGPREEQIHALTSLLAGLMEKKAGSETPLKETKIHRFRDNKAREKLQVLVGLGEGADFPGDSKFTGAPTPEPSDSDGESSSFTAAEGTRSAAPGPESGARSTIRIATKNDPSFWRLPRDRNRSHRGWNSAYWALPILVGVAAFVAGRTTTDAARRPRTAAPAETAAPSLRWSADDLTRLDGILEADQAGNLDSAYRAVMSLKTQAGPLPGLEVYLHLLEARLGNLPNARSTLTVMSHSGLEGTQLVDINNGLAFTLARARKFPQASLSLKAVAMAEPFAPEAFRRWGESLRREGHLEEAVKAFRQALARYPVGAVEYIDLREYVEYVIRLTQIEGGFSVDPHRAPAEQGATANSAGYWFLTDAAAALQHGDEQAAAAALQKAKAALPISFFNALLRDYFFRTYATLRGVAAFFPARPDALQDDLNSRRVYFIDP